MEESFTLELLSKLVLEIQAEQKAIRVEMEQGFAALDEKVEAQSTTLVKMR